MRVRCLTNRGSNLPEVYLDPSSGYSSDTTFHLQPGKDYVVYALTLRSGGVWYYVLNEVYDAEYHDYPIWHPAPLFEIVDPRISQHWIWGFVNDGLRDGDAIFAFPEWAQHPFDYYDQLTDGVPAATAIFRKYRELMAFEFRDATADGIPEDVGDGWLLCPHCKDAFRDSGHGEMVRCSECQRVLIRPTMWVEKLEKEPEIIDLIARLMERLGRPNLALCHEWEADRCAIGFRRPRQHRPLVYVSTNEKQPGRYWVELEAPAVTADEEPYVTAGKFEDVGFEEVVALTARFLGLTDLKSSHAT